MFLELQERRKRAAVSELIQKAYRSMAIPACEEGIAAIAAISRSDGLKVDLRQSYRGSCDGRVVKALDLKSNGVSPRRFEPCSQRQFFLSSSFIFLTPNTVLCAFNKIDVNNQPYIESGWVN